MSHFAARTFRPVLVVGILAAGLVAAAVVFVGVSRFSSSDQPSQAPPAEETQVSSDVTDLQLEKFAVTLSEIADIQAKMKERMLQATDQTAVQEAEQEASAQMVEAVRRNGMSVEEYALLSRAIQEDSDLWGRLQKVQRGLDTAGSRIE